MDVGREVREITGRHGDHDGEILIEIEIQRQEEGKEEEKETSMKKIIAELNAQLIKGVVYTTPGETIRERENSPYCLQPGSHCHTCLLVSFGKDCRGNPVVDRLACRQCDETDRAAGVDWRKFASHP